VVHSARFLILRTASDVQNEWLRCVIVVLLSRAGATRAASSGGIFGHQQHGRGAAAVAGHGAGSSCAVPSAIRPRHRAIQVRTTLLKTATHSRADLRTESSLRIPGCLRLTTRLAAIVALSEPHRATLVSALIVAVLNSMSDLNAILTVSVYSPHTIRQGIDIYIVPWSDPCMLGAAPSSN